MNPPIAGADFVECLVKASLTSKTTRTVKMHVIQICTVPSYRVVFLFASSFHKTGSILWCTGWSMCCLVCLSYQLPPYVIIIHYQK